MIKKKGLSDALSMRILEDNFPLELQVKKQTNLIMHNGLKTNLKRALCALCVGWDTETVEHVLMDGLS